VTSNPWPYIVACFVITAAVIGAYAVWVLRKGRELTERVPVQRRRWADQQVTNANADGAASVGDK
jgi:hypothetical protein